MINAQSRKNVVLGSDNVFTVEAGEDIEKSSGWGVPVKLPAHLAARVEGLRERFSNGKSLEQKQKLAAANRMAFHAAIVGKAREMSADRVVAANSRKQLMMGNEDCFRVEFAKPEKAGDSDGAMEKKSGWGQPASPNMPKHLAKRAAHYLKSSPTKKDIADKFKRSDANRAKFNDSIRAKASKTIAKMQAARARKLLNEMDAGIVLLNTAQQRQLSPVKLPKRLSERVEKLAVQFGYDGAEREKRVEENRLRRINEIRAKAAAASARVAAAKDRRAIIKRNKELERMNSAHPSDSSYEEQPPSSSLADRRPSSCEKAKNQGCVIA